MKRIDTKKAIMSKHYPKKDIDSILRVNQAGEYGAKRIYQGQLAALKNSALKPIIQHMANQEEEHLSTFNKMCTNRRVRPTLFSPLWHVFGFGLGYVSGKIGEKAAMSCTVAVENVIDQHYKSQLDYLNNTYPDQEDELKATIEKFREEEAEHHDIGLEYGAEKMPGYSLFSCAVRSATRLAIKISKTL